MRSGVMFFFHLRLDLWDKDFAAAILAALFVRMPSGYGAGSTMWCADHWLHMMDKDKDGVISRDEFAQFMRQNFDRLDKKHTCELDRCELRPLVDGRWSVGRHEEALGTTEALGYKQRTCERRSEFLRTC